MASYSQSKLEQFYSSTLSQSEVNLYMRFLHTIQDLSDRDANAHITEEPLLQSTATAFSTVLHTFGLYYQDTRVMAKIVKHMLENCQYAHDIWNYFHSTKSPNLKALMPMVRLWMLDINLLNTLFDITHKDVVMSVSLFKLVFKPLNPAYKFLARITALEFRIHYLDQHQVNNIKKRFITQIKSMIAPNEEWDEALDQNLALDIVPDTDSHRQNLYQRFFQSISTDTIPTHISRYASTLTPEYSQSSVSPTPMP